MPIHPDFAPLLAAMPAVEAASVPLEQQRAIPLFPDPDAPALTSMEDVDIESPNGLRTVRIHRPLGEGPRPTVVYIHGGGWVVGYPSAATPTTARLSAYLGAVVVSIGYRLAPENPFPAAFEDVLFLTRWAAEHVGELGGRPDALAVAGESAGGNLAAAVAVALRGQGVLAGQLLINPALDLSEGRRGTDSYRADADPALTTSNLDYFVSAYLGADHSTNWRASPVSAPDFTGIAPALIGVSGNDPLCDDGPAYADKLVAAGVEAKVLVFDDLIHAYASQAFIVPAAHDAFARTCEEFRRLMGWPTP